MYESYTAAEIAAEIATLDTAQEKLDRLMVMRQDLLNAPRPDAATRDTLTRVWGMRLLLVAMIG